MQLSRADSRPRAPVVLVGAAVLWNLVQLHDLTLGVAYLNDSVVHEQMVRFAVGQLRSGRFPLTAWFPYLGLGSPQFLHYQSLPALLTGLIGLAVGPNVAFRWTLYLLLSLWPVSVYGCARLFGARPWAAAASAAMSPFLVALNRENRAGPPPARVPGPAGFYATALWLRAGFADLRYEVHHALADGGLVAVNSTMSGRHVAPWAVYTDDGAVDTVFPPTGRTFAVTQSHWFRIEDGLITVHWANRDGIGMSRQLGWIPPTPAYLLKMARAKRRTKRS